MLHRSGRLPPCKEGEQGSHLLQGPEREHHGQFCQDPTSPWLWVTSGCHWSRSPRSGPEESVKDKEGGVSWELWIEKSARRVPLFTRTRRGLDQDRSPPLLFDSGSRTQCLPIVRSSESTSTLL